MQIIQKTFNRKDSVNYDGTIGLTTYTLSYVLENGETVTVSGEFYEPKGAYEYLRNKIELRLLNQKFDGNVNTEEPCNRDNLSVVPEEPASNPTRQEGDNQPSLGDLIESLTEKLSLLTNDVRDLRKNLTDELEKLEERVKVVEDKGTQIPWSWPWGQPQPYYPMPDPVNPATPGYPTYPTTPNYPWITWHRNENAPWWEQYTTTCSANPNGKKQ